MFVSKFITFVWFISAGVLASPQGSLYARASTSFNPNDVKDTVCDNPSAKIDNHDSNVALLQICGGIAKEIQKCRGNPTSTEGQSGTALFKLNPVEQGATINVSKGRWERCIRAAKAVCPTGEYHSTCKGGTSNGDLNFSLTAT
ncbi:hypothetical protein EPUL_001209 [Erysiphe pulchra]|uniref:Secreted protein n=1 Tax=Erysiphe pulchra TaxID=225359 RepID=A0A2S4PU30_9PEZI|nr:hypothetical protein EPUL_001209 [Erysiphe pulchra]